MEGCQVKLLNSAGAELSRTAIHACQPVPKDFCTSSIFFFKFIDDLHHDYMVEYSGGTWWKGIGSSTPNFVIIESEVPRWMISKDGPYKEPLFEYSYGRVEGKVLEITEFGPDEEVILRTFPEIKASTPTTITVTVVLGYQVTGYHEFTSEPLYGAEHISTYEFPIDPAGAGGSFRPGEIFFSFKPFPPRAIRPTSPRPLEFEKHFCGERYRGKPEDDINPIQN